MEELDAKVEPRKKIKVVRLIALAVVIIFIVGSTLFYFYTNDYYHSTLTLQQVIAADTSIAVDQLNGSIVFSPKGQEPKTGIIFYPGAKVEYIAYAQLMMQIAKTGYTCILVNMPFNLAVFDANAADKIISSHPKIKNWVIGGHSLGGAMACTYAATHASKLKGVLLLAAYTSTDLSKTKLKVLSINATLDGILNKTTFEDSIALMPDDSVYIEISGGNHAQFGYYGTQSGDNPATVTREEQIKSTVFAIGENLIFK